MPPKILDRDRPYAEVHGMLGVAYEQDGLTFNRAGIQSVASEYVDEVRPPDDPNVFPSVEMQESPAQDEIAGGTSIETMHWRHLKTLVESYGGTWTNRADALVFLKKGEK